MTGEELRAARGALGEAWGLGRPLHMSELGRALRLQGRDPGSTVRDWERREGPTGPAAVAIETWLRDRSLPPDPIEDIVDPRNR
jgi:hypothetical protein